MEAINLIDSFAEFKELKNIDRATLMRVLEDIFRNMLLKRYGTDFRMILLSFVFPPNLQRNIKPQPVGKTTQTKYKRPDDLSEFSVIIVKVDSTSAFYDDNRKFFFIRFLSDIFSKYSAIYSSLLPNTVLFSSFILYL